MIAERRARLLACVTIAAPAIVVVPLPGIEPGFHAAVKLVALLGAALIFAIAARSARELTRTEALLAVFAVLAIASTVLASGLADGAAAIGCAIGLCAIARSSRAVLRGRWDIVETAVACAAAGTAAIAVLELVGAQLPWAELRRPASTIGNRNQLAGLLTIMLPVLVGAVLRGRRLAAPTVVLVVTVIVASHCRSAYLATIVALVLGAIAYATHRRRGGAAIDRRSMVVVAGALVLGGVLGMSPWPGVAFGPSVWDSAGRVLDYETGSGHARLVQHEIVANAFARDPAALLTGFGPAGWESLTSSHAHELGHHAPRMWTGALPNSDLLRIVVEQGAVALVLLATAFGLALRSIAARDLVERNAALASLVVAGVLALFDPQLVRPERVALLGVLLGASVRSPCIAADRRVGTVVIAVVACACVFALLRATSYAASSEIMMTREADRLAYSSERLALAERLFPRSSLAERRAVVAALGDRCDEADASLRRFVVAHPRYWGARVEVARCFARSGRIDDARRLWNEAIAVEPHLRELLARSEH